MQWFSKAYTRKTHETAPSNKYRLMHTKHMDTHEQTFEKKPYHILGQLV